MKIEGYEEISEEEWDYNNKDEGLYVNDWYTKKPYYFKKVQKFPIVFEDNDNLIEVTKEHIKITLKEGEEVTYLDYNESFPLLVKAVEKAKEVMKKNGK